MMSTTTTTTSRFIASGAEDSFDEEDSGALVCCTNRLVRNHRTGARRGDGDEEKTWDRITRLRRRVYFWFINIKPHRQFRDYLSGKNKIWLIADDSRESIFVTVKIFYLPTSDFIYFGDSKKDFLRHEMHELVVRKTLLQM